MTEGSIIIEILSSGTYALIMFFIMSIVISFINSAARDKVREKDLNSYNDIVGRNSLFFERGGVSPADIGSYVRFYKYLLGHDAKNTVGFSMWVFYRIWIPFYIMSIAWLVVAGLIFIVQE